MGVRLHYIDDSGAVDTGHVVYSWVEVDITQWRTGLRAWLDFRHDLARTEGVPASYELHATQFVGGRGSPSRDPDWNRVKAHRSRVAQAALDVVARTSCLQVGTVYRVTPARGRDFHAERADAYQELVRLLDRRLAGTGDLGMMIMDGDGNDPTYARAHRALRLSTRSVVEDPMFQHSHASQWVQLADLVAWTTYQHLLRHEGKRFAWPWYERHLQSCDALGGPQEV